MPSFGAIKIHETLTELNENTQFYISPANIPIYLKTNENTQLRKKDVSGMMPKRGEDVYP